MNFFFKVFKFTHFLDLMHTSLGAYLIDVTTVIATQRFKILVINYLNYSLFFQHVL